jgi:hypothetical protein
MLTGKSGYWLTGTEAGLEVTPDLVLGSTASGIGAVANGKDEAIGSTQAAGIASAAASDFTKSFVSDLVRAGVLKNG